MRATSQAHLSHRRGAGMPRMAVHRQRASLLRLRPRCRCRARPRLRVLPVRIRPLLHHRIGRGGTGHRRRRLPRMATGGCEARLQRVREPGPHVHGQRLSVRASGLPVLRAAGFALLLARHRRVRIGGQRPTPSSCSRPARRSTPGPPTATGKCPQPQGLGLPRLAPVYRLWNARTLTNHRFTTSAAQREAMIAGGWVSEGVGPLGVAMCVPTTPE